MATALPKWEGLHTIGTSSFGVTVDAGTEKFLTASDHYWSSVADGGTLSLIAAFQALLRAAPNGVANTTVAMNATTGVLVITWGSGTHSLDWSNTTIRDRFGATGNFAAAAVLTMQRQAKGVWLPNVPAAGHSGSVTGLWLPKSNKRISESDSGVVWATGSTPWNTTKFEWRGLTKAKALTADESRVNESFQTFWTDCLNTGAGIFRHHADRTVDATYKTCVSKLIDMQDASRFFRKTDSNWNIDVPANEYQHVATGGGF